MVYVLEWGSAGRTAPALFTSLASEIARNEASVRFEVVEPDSVRKDIATAELPAWLTAGLALVEASSARSLHVSVAAPRRVFLAIYPVRRGEVSWWSASLESDDDWPAIGYVRAKELALDYVVLSADDGPPQLDDGDLDGLPWSWPLVVVSARRLADGTWDERLGESGNATTLADLQRGYDICGRGGEPA